MAVDAQIAVALVVSIPPTLMALAAWRKTASVQDSMGPRNGRGTAQHQLARLEDKIDAIGDWQLRHLERDHLR